MRFVSGLFFFFFCWCWSRDPLVMGGCGDTSRSTASWPWVVPASVAVWTTPAWQLVMLVANSWGKNNYQGKDRPWVSLVIHLKVKFVKGSLSRMGTEVWGVAFPGWRASVCYQPCLPGASLTLHPCSCSTSYCKFIKYMLSVLWFSCHW